jgi:hypothetical protein
MFHLLTVGYFSAGARAGAQTPVAVAVEQVRCGVNGIAYFL